MARNCSTCGSAKSYGAMQSPQRANLNVSVIGNQRSYQPHNATFIKVTYLGVLSNLPQSVVGISYQKVKKGQQLIVHVDDLLANTELYTVDPTSQARFEQYLEDNNLDNPYATEPEPANSPFVEVKFDKEALMELPYIGEITADKLLENGIDTKPELLANISNYVGESRAEAIKEALNG